MKKHFSKILACVLATTTIFGCVGCNSAEQNSAEKDTGKTVVAVFNNENILQEDIQPMLDFMSAAYDVAEGSENWDAMKYSTIQAYLNDKICSLKADEMKIKVTDEELQTEINYAITQYGGEEAYEEFITSVNATREFVESQMKAQLVYNKLFEAVTKDIVISEEELQKYFNEHPDEFVTKETRDVYGIAFATKEEAEAALVELKEGRADFTAMANEKSLDNQNGDGFLGSVSRGDLVDAFDTAVFSMEADTYYSEVLPLDADLADGTVSKYYYIVKATNFVPSEALSYESVKEDLKASLTRDMKQAKYDTEFESWKSEYEYKIVGEESSK